VVEPALFEMSAPIQSPAKCEVRSVIRFHNAKAERPAGIRKQIVAVYGNVMNFYLFLHLKKHVAGEKFDDDDEVQEEVMTWFKGQFAKNVPMITRTLLTRSVTLTMGQADCCETSLPIYQTTVSHPEKL
jgi:hypothetical protein